MSSPIVDELRLLPLLSSGTEIVHALGLGQYQVGRSHECDYPAAVRSLPACTRATIPRNASSSEIDALVKQASSSLVSIYQIDRERIGQLRPTHVITQTQCDVCAVSIAEVQQAIERELKLSVTIVPLQAFALDGLWLDIERVAKACGRLAAGTSLVGRLKGRLQSIASLSFQAATRPSVVALEWTDPLMTAGNWVPELIEIAGGRSLLAPAGGHSPHVTMADLQAADPEVIALTPCGFDLDRTWQEAKLLATQRGWTSLRAVRNSSVFVCDGNQYINRSGPRLVESAQIFAEILHPEYFPPTLRGTGWQAIRY